MAARTKSVRSKSRKNKLSRKPSTKKTTPRKATASSPQSRSAIPETCPHCVSGEETYGYLKRAWVYDVDEARKIVSDGREPVEMDAADVAYCVDNSRIHEQHIDHVDVRWPGILAHLWGPGRDGSIQEGHLLIDGNHRAARCLRDQVPFRAYVLTEMESERILLRGMCRDGSVRNELENESED